MSAAGGNEEGPPQPLPDWTALPQNLLVLCFDNLITCPTAHPSYLKHKAFHVASIRLTCTTWRDALNVTPIGVCLPPKLPAHVRSFLCSLTLRRLEFHDPDHTSPSVVKLLSDPRFITTSGKSLLTIMDAPYDGLWKPTDFPNLAHLEVRRYGKASPVFDVSCIKGMTWLSDLVLASGFHAMKHMEDWPVTCKHLVWSSTAGRFTSRLTVPSLPPHLSLHFISLRACEVRFLDLQSLMGRVQEIMVHAELIFFKVPWQLYPTLQDAATGTPPLSSTQPNSEAGSTLASPSRSAGGSAAPAAEPATSPAAAAEAGASSGGAQDAGTSSGADTAGTAGGDSGGAVDAKVKARRAALAPAHLRKVKCEDWTQEGLQALADMCVNEHMLIFLRMKFIRALISHPTRSAKEEGPSFNPHVDGYTWLHPHGTAPWGPAGGPGAPQDPQHEEGQDGEEEESSEWEEEGAGNEGSQPPGEEVCRHCGQVHGADGPHGGGDDDGDSEDEDLTFDEVAPDQVEQAFRKAIQGYEEALAARRLTAPIRKRPLPPPPPPLSPELMGYNVFGVVRGCGHTDMDGSMPQFVVPMLKTGKANSASPDKEVTMTRKHADPREPITIKLDVPGGNPEHTLAVQGPIITGNKRPVQSVAFAPWPYTHEQIQEFTPADDPAIVALAQLLESESTSSPQADSTPAAAAAAAAAAASGTAQGLSQALGVVQRMLHAFSTRGGSSSARGTDQARAARAATVRDALGAALAEQSKVQAQLLGSSTLVQQSQYILRKINYLALSPGISATQARALMAPFMQLTKVSVILSPELSCYTEPVFPLSVIKVTLYASGYRQHFDSKMVSNLTELWRLTLSGFHSHDLGSLPSVRPGFELKVLDPPHSRQEPLGQQGLDVLPKPGHIQEWLLQVGTNKSPQECEMRPARVHLAAWAPLVRDLHVRCPPGVELWTGARDIHEFFRNLSDAQIRQFSVSFTTSSHMSIAIMPVDGGAQGPFLPMPPVFAFVMTRGGTGGRVHGMNVAEMVRNGEIPGWSMDFMDSEEPDAQDAHLYAAHICFFRTDLVQEMMGMMMAGAVPPGAGVEEGEGEEEEEEQGVVGLSQLSLGSLD